MAVVKIGDVWKVLLVTLRVSFASQLGLLSTGQVT